MPSLNACPDAPPDHIAALTVAPAVSPSPSTAVSTVRVVLVDDSPAIRMALRELLDSMAGGRTFEIVGEAGTGSEGIYLAAAERPDLVILDVEMPVMGGMVALPQILRAAPAAQVVVFSATDSRQEALELGATAFVPKGDAAALVETIAACCPGGSPAGVPTLSEAGSR